MSIYAPVELFCAKCHAVLTLKITGPGQSHGIYSSWVHEHRLSDIEPEYCRDDDGSSFAADTAEPSCPECSGPIERSEHSGSWVCVEHGTDHFHLDPAATYAAARLARDGVA